MADVAYSETSANPDVGEIRSYVHVRIGALTLAIEAADVVEITDLHETIPLPRAPAHLLGLMPVRDRSVPLVSLASFVGAPGVVHDHEHRVRVVIIHRDGMRVGIACDEVRGVRELGQRTLVPLAQTMSNGIAPYATHEHASEDGKVLVLDLGAFLAAARVRKR